MRTLALTVLCAGSLAAQTFHATPLTDLGTGQYLGQFQGGLFENGTNLVPMDHDAVLRAAAAGIVPRNTTGIPDHKGKIVFMSIGMSNTTNEWCEREIDYDAGHPCTANSFTGRAKASSSVNHGTMVMVDGAVAGQPLQNWLSPSSPNWATVNARLSTANLTGAQVQAIWLFHADSILQYAAPVSLPDPNADAYYFERNLGIILRELRGRYPNLKVVFLSSLTYVGYGCHIVPEPYGYEQGFGAKWTIQAQINQERAGAIDPIAGDLSSAAAPRITWASYQWADDGNPRLDGMTWLTTDLWPDFCHPNDPSGVVKTSNLLMQYFLSSPYSAWFRN